MIETATLAPTSISAEELHRFLLTAHKVQARARRRFLEGLLQMEESRLYTLMGSPR